MKDKIKEIQERLDYHKEIGKEPEYCEDLITTGELQRLLDYITNLKKELNATLKNYGNLVKEWKILQKENEKLKHNLEQMYNDTKDIYNEICAEQIDYKSRNEKAIE